MVQGHRRLTAFIGQASPVKIWRIPGFRQETAGVSRKGGQGTDIQQFPPIGLSQAGMGHAKIVRQALPVYLFGMLERESLQLLGRGSPRTYFSRVPALKFCREIKRIGGGHASKGFGYV